VYVTIFFYFLHGLPSFYKAQVIFMTLIHDDYSSASSESHNTHARAHRATNCLVRRSIVKRLQGEPRVL